jgi:hypothetical protein
MPGETQVRSPARRLFRRVAVLGAGSLVAASVALITPAAQAVAPANDRLGNATLVTGLPFEDSVDVRRATKDRVSLPEMRNYRNHTVWYHVDLEADADLLVSTAGTNYRHKVALYRTDPENPGPAHWTKLKASSAYPGETFGAGFLQPVQADANYFIVVGARRGWPGGTLELVLRPPAEYTVDLSATGTYNEVDGSATLHGTVSSDRPTDVLVAVTLRQLVNGEVVTMGDSKHLSPQAEPTPWDLTIGAEDPFQPGEARVASSIWVVYDVGIWIASGPFPEDTVTLE